jgi:hypothetical protein
MPFFGFAREPSLVALSRLHKGSEKMGNFSNFFVEIFIKFVGSILR